MKLILFLIAVSWWSFIIISCQNDQERAEQILNEHKDCGIIAMPCKNDLNLQFAPTNEEIDEYDRAKRRAS